MGLGGYLTWTAAAREICARIQGIKVFPFEQHGQLIKPIKSEIFHNNPNFLQSFPDAATFCFPLQLNHPDTNYCKKDTPERAYHRYDRHIIEQICEKFGIDNPELRCDIFLTENEEVFIEELLESYKIDVPFVTIDPSCNKEYTKNKFDQFETWQKVVNSIRDKVKVVQLGSAGAPVLDGVVNLTGTTTFRQAAGVVGKSKCFIGSEGGLVHAATAFDTPCVIVVSGFIHPRLTSYNGHEVIWANDSGHGPCGMKVHCEQCTADSKSLYYEEIVVRINKVLEI